jgi:hypothetical protein
MKPGASATFCEYNERDTEDEKTVAAVVLIKPV